MGTSARGADCYDFVADCRIRAVTDLLSHSWDPVVLVALRQGPHRRNALITAIGDVSDKAVTESLRRLTASGLVMRTPDSTPRNVEYDLTALGASLVHGPLAVIGQWAIDHGHELVS
ncbi:MAG: helix-turn-helix transcriptional regulator [Hamadaea sp.]|uniref:winged helix-turn-helix transcriptional regulator n=1 Tax=Hamadaea sp. TaxID=2024425 RepID=UPI00180EC61E|nr:helix-turn-helix domain-containing protein [Hamadaea sp.]NUT21804.1 helix-turn-helix transcriptional regulator [Hamadaea sp.]